jgi:hypothetical protein
LEAPNPEKPPFQFFLKNQLLKDEIEKKKTQSQKKKLLKEKIEINRMRVKFEEKKNERVDNFGLKG